MQLGASRSHLGCHGHSRRPCRQSPISRKEVGFHQPSTNNRSTAQRQSDTVAAPSAASSTDSNAGTEADGTLDQKSKPERRRRLNRATISIDAGTCDMTAPMASISLGTSIDSKPLWPIALQEYVFNSREEMFQLFALILKSAQLGQPLSISDQRLVVQLLKVAHPRACDKIGMGVRRVTAEAHVMFPGVRNFVVHRGDGSEDNFSYRKCINNLTGWGWTLEAPPLIRLQHQANKVFVHRAGPDARALQEHELPQDAANERECLIDDIFIEFDRLGPQQGPSHALLAMSALATCLHISARRASVLVEDKRFLRLESHLTPQGAQDLVRSHHSYLNAILGTVRLLQYVPSMGLLDALAVVAKQRLRRFNCSELSDLTRNYATMGGRYAPPRELLWAVTRRFMLLLSRFNDAPVGAVGMFYHAMALMEPMPRNDQRLILSHIIEGRGLCTRVELSLVLLALGIAQNAPVIESREVDLLVATLLSKLDSIDECVQSVAAVPPATPQIAQALPVQQMLCGLQCMQHRPTPHQLLHLCSLLEAHGSALSSPHEVLTSLASLGVAPLSAHSGPGVVDALIASAFSKLTAPGQNGTSALSTAWALAVLKRGDVTGFRDIWGTACSQFKGKDRQQGCKLFHTAMLVHFEVPAAADVLVGRRVMEWAQQLWVGVLKTHSVSDLHRQVATVLTVLGLHYVVEYLTLDGLQSIDLVLRPSPPPQQQPGAGEARRTQQPQISSFQEGTIPAVTTTTTTSAGSSNKHGPRVASSGPDAAPAQQASMLAVHPGGQSGVQGAGMSVEEEGSLGASPPIAATPTLATDAALQWEPGAAVASLEDGSPSPVEERLARRPEWRQSDPLELLDRPHWSAQASVADDDDGSGFDSYVAASGSDFGGSHMMASDGRASRPWQSTAGVGEPQDVWGSGCDKRDVWSLPSTAQLLDTNSSTSGSSGGNVGRVGAGVGGGIGNVGIMNGSPREVLDLMRDAIASSHSAVIDAEDDAALLEALQGGWASACSPAIKRALEADLTAAGLPRVAIEVDGPTHWASNCNAPLGRTQTRNRLLKTRGWMVVTVASHDWKELDTGAQKAAYVALRLREAGVPVSQFRAAPQSQKTNVNNST